MKTQNVQRRTILSAVLIILSAALPRTAAGANQYKQHNLVSDIPGIADQTDPNLVNPWGISMSPTSPFWISNNHAGNTTVYNGQGQPTPAASPVAVRIPAPRGGAPLSAPTGQVFNDTPGFMVNGKPAVFLFATEDGTISGWNPAADPQNAILLVDNSGAGAVYKGLALANTNNGPRLYAANFNTGNIDVYDANLTSVTAARAFTDPQIPSGFAPFNVQRIGRKLYVTYAKQDNNRHDDVAGAGNGFVDVFDFQGAFLARLVSNGPLNSPWGLALAPGTFGDFSNALLIGNFGDGAINAFDPCSGEFLGALRDPTGANITIGGLWGLSFGNGRGAGDATTLYFTAGIPGSGNVEDHGLFGSIQAADSASAPMPQATPVNIAYFSFAPQNVSVAVGAQVQWTNQDGAAHTVTADDGRFGSDALDHNQAFSQTFDTPGTYSYHCAI